MSVLWWTAIVPALLFVIGGIVWLIIQVTEIRTELRPMYDWWLRTFSPKLPLDK